MGRIDTTQFLRNKKKCSHGSGQPRPADQVKIKLPPVLSVYIYTFSSPPSSTHTHIKMIIKKHKNHPIQTFYTCEVVRTRTLCLTQTAVEKHRTHLLPLNVDLDQSSNKPNNDVRNKLHRDHIHMIRKT